MWHFGEADLGYNWSVCRIFEHSILKRASLDIKGMYDLGVKNDYDLHHT